MINTQSDINLYIEYSKFIQNAILEQNIPCYLIGGALINCLRDNGKLLTDDIDFAIIFDGNFSDILKILEKSGLLFSWECFNSILRIFPLCRKELKIELFLFVKRHVNYYMYEAHWPHERISSFQTFKEQKVVLENKEFVTFFKPELFLTTVYGDWRQAQNAYFCRKGGDTTHLKDCIFYTNEDNYDKIDFQVENLKIIFKTVSVKRNLEKIDDSKINIFDNFYSEQVSKETNLFYSDFVKFFIKEKIKYFDLQ